MLPRWRGRKKAIAKILRNVPRCVAEAILVANWQKIPRRDFEIPVTVPKVELPSDAVEFRMAGRKVEVDDPQYRLKKAVKLETMGISRENRR